MSSVVYNCVKYGLEVPRSKRNIPLKVAKNEQAKVQWDFHIQPDKLVMANQSHIAVVDK